MLWGATTLYKRTQLDVVLEIMLDGQINWKARPKVFNFKVQSYKSLKIFKWELGEYWNREEVFKKLGPSLGNTYG